MGVSTQSTWVNAEYMGTVRAEVHLFEDKTCCLRECHNRKTCLAKELKGFLARDSPQRGQGYHVLQKRRQTETYVSFRESWSPVSSRSYPPIFEEPCCIGW